MDSQIPSVGDMCIMQAFLWLWGVLQPTAANQITWRETCGRILTVYREFRGVADSAQLFPLRQPSNSTSNQGASASIGSEDGAPVRRPPPRTLHCLIHRAQEWLIRRQRDNWEAPLSASIYWAIYSLQFVYARQLFQAELQGAVPLVNTEDDDWPAPPWEEDNFDWTVVPTWLYTLLTMDQIHEWYWSPDLILMEYNWLTNKLLFDVS